MSNDLSTAARGETTAAAPSEARAASNGADALIRTLADNGVTACFANPGTSEMQFVAALDREPRMSAVLCLFEGVATGAADGYGRMADRPAATLLHLGAGYANGGANLHNARRARTPVVNVVGDHATYHRAYDTPLSSDIAGWAAPNSAWVRSADHADRVGPLAAEAVTASLGPPGGCATLILPADSAWNATAVRGRALAPSSPVAPDAERIAEVAAGLRGAKAAGLLIGGRACRARGLAAAARLAAAGVRVWTETFVARQRRGAGIFAPARLAYFGEVAHDELADLDTLVLVEAQAPAAFFAYPDKPSALWPEGCRIEMLAGVDEAGDVALEMLADLLEAPPAGPVACAAAPPAPQGDLFPQSAGAAIARHLPHDAIISDDAVTAGMPIFLQTASAAPHDWLMLTGGAIGQGIPLAIGAAVACPDRKVVSLNGDGAAMYTVQGLWTIAREQLDVTVVVFANGAYKILNVEFGRTGSGRPGPAARRLLDLGRPTIAWTTLAESLGVPATRCETAEAFDAAFASAMGRRGPRLIEAVMSPPPQRVGA
ncbi:MAG: acetolactate synthase large subunit [Phenylobacterium sp.]|uniref:acetolactate synthase large subunit n=1 Tax=Phenylobacterium sp. TaxID=1871053 RepID=UPI001A4BA485|nr:acetolactate synthase large subunit [Phenylobacterium sp.]MBL8553998.1 acetolactate synthase large subunit [Phenylobacterium sp.]